MDCRNVQEKLGVIQPNSNDLNELELADAAEHLQSCPRCQKIVRRHQELDRRYGRICRDVPLPEGLKERLLQLVQTELSSKTSPAKIAGEESSRAGIIGSYRHSRLKVAASLAACALLAISMWWISRLNATISVDQLAEITVERFGSLNQMEPFEGDFQPGQQFPLSMRPLRRGAFKRLPTESHVQASVCAFSLPMRQAARVEGALLMVPLRDIKSMPAATSLRSARPNYIYDSSGQFTYKVWTEGTWVYICVVRGEDSGLQELEAHPSLT